MSQSQWTVDTLKSLMDERHATQSKALDAAFVAAEKAVQVALESAEKAVSKAELAADKRFESVNEFRATLQDQQGTFVTRVELRATVTSVIAVAAIVVAVVVAIMLR